MRISDWSSDVCSSDLRISDGITSVKTIVMKQTTGRASNGDQSLLNVRDAASFLGLSKSFLDKARIRGDGPHYLKLGSRVLYRTEALQSWLAARERRSEEHTSELQSLMRISYAVFCLKKKNQT